MSRIHDALRRGHGPAGLPITRRTAHADAVLSALGYKSEKPAAARVVVKILAGLLSVGLLAAVPLMTGPDVLDFVWKLDSRSASTPAPAPRSAPPALPATSTIAGPDPRIGLPRNEPRSPVLESRTSGPQPGADQHGPAASTVPAPTVTKTAVVPPPSRSLRLQATGTVARVPAAQPESNPPAVIAAPAAPKAVPAAPDEFQLALYYQRSGDFEQALMHYRAALQRDEMHVEAHNNLGNLYLGKGLLDEAAREFQRVIAIDPKYSNAHVNLSAVYTRLGRPDAAAAEARAALQIDGRNPDAMVNLSLAQHDAGLTADAQRSLRRALEIDPHNAAAHYNMARQFEAAGDLSSAIAHYNQFIQYASPEQTGFAADVRARVAALTARLK